MYFYLWNKTYLKFWFMRNPSNINFDIGKFVTISDVIPFTHFCWIEIKLLLQEHLFAVLQTTKFWLSLHCLSYIHDPPKGTLSAKNKRWTTILFYVLFSEYLVGSQIRKILCNFRFRLFSFFEFKKSKLCTTTVCISNHLFFYWVAIDTRF